MNLFEGDCLQILKEFEDNRFDSLVTDPPAGISFMGKEWDGNKGGRDGWVQWLTEVMREAYRVMKPGAHGLVWAIPRTSHWTATALELAGFEIRDQIFHLFGSGFPKSHDISKAIDKAAGAEREAKPLIDPNGRIYHQKEQSMGEFNACKVRQDFPDPITDAAKQWDGFGTALKPAAEIWILVRKPCSEKTVAANVLRWSTGALNIDASRVSGHNPSIDRRKSAAPKESVGASGWMTPARPESYNDARPGESLGRFPANVLLSHTPECEADICVSGISFDDNVVSEALNGLISSLPQGSQDDCLFFYGFYDELLRLVSKHVQDVFPSGFDVHAFLSYYLRSIQDSLSRQSTCHLSSLGGFLSAYRCADTLQNKDSSLPFGAKKSSGTLDTFYLAGAFLTPSNNTPENNKGEGDSGEISQDRIRISDRLRTLCFLNTCLASVYDTAFFESTCPVRELDRQSGNRSSSGVYKNVGTGTGNGATYFAQKPTGAMYSDSGGASSFFYCAKASKRDRNAGLEGMEKKRTFGNDKGDGSKHPNENFHPTVKPSKLMEYLITLITPPGGYVLDPFMGSGSTGVAARRLYFEFCGIEKQKDYFEIAKKRIETSRVE